LYLDALISYPRTSSQKLPPQIGYEVILKKLGKSGEHGKLVDKLLVKPELKPTMGKKEDSAHPAIYPTGNLPERALNNAEKNIWNLVVRRFMAAFGEPATRQSVKASITVNGNQFYVERTQILDEGWFGFYKPYIQLENTSLPPMKKGQQVSVEKVVLEDKFTKPPARYNPSSLLRKMEKEDIGTKATRAGTIQTLYDRKYVCDEKMSVTDLGFEVIEEHRAGRRPARNGGDGDVIDSRLHQARSTRVGRRDHEVDRLAGEAIEADRGLGPAGVLLSRRASLFEHGHGARWADDAHPQEVVRRSVVEIGQVVGKR